MLNQYDIYQYGKSVQHINTANQYAISMLKIYWSCTEHYGLALYSKWVFNFRHFAGDS